MPQLFDYVISVRRVDAKGRFEAEPGDETLFLKVPLDRAESDSLGADSDWSKPMFQRIMRLTNYSNGFDDVRTVSNAKRLGTAPRVGRVGLPADANRKGVNVDCSDYFKTIDPKQAKFVGWFPHSWHIGDPAFARDLAMTLEGRYDRDVLPTREAVSGGSNSATRGVLRSRSIGIPRATGRESDWNQTSDASCQLSVAGLPFLPTGIWRLASNGGCKDFPDTNCRMRLTAARPARR